MTLSHSLRGFIRYLNHERMVKNKIKLAQIINRAIADSGIIQNAADQNKTVTLSLT